MLMKLAGEAAQLWALHVPREPAQGNELLAWSGWGLLACRGLVGGKLGREMFCAVFIWHLSVLYTLTDIKSRAELLHMLYPKEF